MSGFNICSLQCINDICTQCTHWPCTLLILLTCRKPPGSNHEMVYIYLGQVMLPDNVWMCITFSRCCSFISWITMSIFCTKFSSRFFQWQKSNFLSNVAISVSLKAFQALPSGRFLSWRNWTITTLSGKTSSQQKLSIDQRFMEEHFSIHLIIPFIDMVWFTMYRANPTVFDHLSQNYWFYEHALKKVVVVVKNKTFRVLSKLANEKISFSVKILGTIWCFTTHVNTYSFRSPLTVFDYLKLFKKKCFIQ